MREKKNIVQWDRLEFVSWFGQCPRFKRFFFLRWTMQKIIFFEGIFLIENKIECLCNLLCHHFIQSPNHSTWKHSISQCVRQCVRCLIKYDEELSLSNWKMDFFLPPSQCYQCFVAFQSANELAKSNHSYFQFGYGTWKSWEVRNCYDCGISIHQVLSDHHIISGMKVFDNFSIQIGLKGSSLFWYGREYPNFLFVSAINTAISNIHVCKWKHYTLYLFIFIHSNESNYCENIWLWMVLSFLFSLFKSFLIQAQNLLNSTFITVFAQPLVVIVFWNNFSKCISIVCFKIGLFSVDSFKRVLLIINQHTFKVQNLIQICRHMWFSTSISIGLVLGFNLKLL